MPHAMLRSAVFYFWQIGHIRTYCTQCMYCIYCRIPHSTLRCAPSMYCIYGIYCTYCIYGCPGWFDLAAQVAPVRPGVPWLPRFGCPGRSRASILLRMGSVFVDFAAQGQCFVKVALVASIWLLCALLGVLAASIWRSWDVLGVLLGVLGALWGALGRSWGALGVLWGRSWCSWAALGRS